MDITPTDNTLQSISDDQELAKALAGVLPEAEETPAPSTDMQFEEVPGASNPLPGAAAPVAPVTVDPTPAPVATFPDTSTTPVAPLNSSVDTGYLEGIKSQALTELRPLIDHVDLPAEDRFDAYLMLLRSTDDSTLVAPAHAAAQSISDEKRKAEALLEIIKEIDYLSRKES